MVADTLALAADKVMEERLAAGTDLYVSNSIDWRGFRRWGQPPRRDGGSGGDSERRRKTKLKRWRRLEEDAREVKGEGEQSGCTVFSGGSKAGMGPHWRSPRGTLWLAAPPTSLFYFNN